MKNRIWILGKRMVILSIVIFSVLTSLLFGAIFFDCWRENLWDNCVDDCQHIGDEIVVALEQYHRDHSRYPDSLSALCPLYLSQIPEHLIGNRQWKYYLTINPKDGFVLSFNYTYLVYGNKSYSYYSPAKSWRLDDEF